MILQLQPPIPLETPKGSGLAHLIIDDGMEFDLVWVVFINDTGECWSFRNPEVRMQTNLTLGRTSTTPIKSKLNESRTA